MPTTTDEAETTVEFHTENGSSGPMPISEFEHRADRAIERLRNEQLSFDVFRRGDSRPDFASMKVKGALAVERDLRRGTGVIVTVATTDGEVLAEGRGIVDWPSFKDHTDKFGTTTERIETVQL